GAVRRAPRGAPPPGVRVRVPPVPGPAAGQGRAADRARHDRAAAAQPGPRHAAGRGGVARRDVPARRVRAAGHLVIDSLAVGAGPYPRAHSAASGMLGGDVRVDVPGPLDLAASLEPLRRWGDDLCDRWDGVALVGTIGDVPYAASGGGDVARPWLDVAVE